MANDPEMATLNRTLKEISHSFQKLTRVMEAVNTNMVELIKRLPPLDAELMESSITVYNPEEALVAVTAGTVKIGDMCVVDGGVDVWMAGGWTPLANPNV